MLVRSAASVLAAAASLLVTSASPASAVVANDPVGSSETNGRVENSVELGTHLYIGGTFTAVDGSAHTNLAALDAATGTLDPGFSVDVNGPVTSLAASGSTLYIAGNFTAVGASQRTNVAAVDTLTGNVLPFQATPSATVQTVDVANGIVYLGGAFTTVNGARRKYVAALDAGTSALLKFNPKPKAKVYVVKATDAGIYIGGNFQTVGTSSRNYVARLNLDGTVQSWTADLPFDTQVFDLTSDGTSVYLATGGHLPGGNSVYRVDAQSGSQQWQVQTDGNVQSVEVAGGTVYGGGHFNFLKPCVQGVCTETSARRKAIAIDPSSGVPLDSWTPVFNSSLGVWDFTAAAGNLYALGDFTTVNGTSHPHIARFDLSSP